MHVIRIASVTKLACLRLPKGVLVHVPTSFTPVRASEDMSAALELVVKSRRVLLRMTRIHRLTVGQVILPWEMSFLSVHRTYNFGYYY
jgi:hypothetical protein